MKSLCALLLLLLLGGCASDPEDREFFDRGWVHPAKEDNGNQMHHSFFWDDDKPGE